MVATFFQSHHHIHENESKMNDIFEQTVIVDKPLSTHFYDHLNEVTIDAEIVIGRKGVIEEIIPLEQWASVISETFTETPEEDWVIEPEEIVYTVVKWEGVEGGEKHVIENRRWKEVAHTPPIHTKHHVSPLDGFVGEDNNPHFSFSAEKILNGQSQTNRILEISNKAEIIFDKPHVSETTETTWHMSSHQKTNATHQSSELSNDVTKGTVNGYVKSLEQNDEPLGAWYKVQSPVENGERQNHSSSGSHTYQTDEHQSTWHKTHVSQPPRPNNFQQNEEFFPTPVTRIPKPRTSPSTYSKPISPGSPPNQAMVNGETKMVSPKVIVKSNGNPVFTSGYSPQPSPLPTNHHFIAAKPACHSTTFMTSYTSNSKTSSPEQTKSLPKTSGTPEKVTWHRHGNQYIRETVPVNYSK
jgi:hypothetical protein